MSFDPILHAPKIIAVVVTYHPILSELCALLLATLPQVDRIIIIDNGSREDCLMELTDFIKNQRIEMHCLGRNYGIATAQNRGMSLVKAYGAQYAMLFDQDSLPSPDIVSRLLEASMSINASGIKVAAVGPFYEDPRRLVPSRPFVSLHGFRLDLLNDQGPEKIIPVSYLIASASLISMDAFDAIGPMHEELFIDYVDIDWGLRARQLGFQSFGVRDALLQHNLGEKIQFIFGKSFCFHSPLRHYYQFRNGLWLYRQPYLSYPEKIGGYGRLIKRFLACAVFFEPRRQNLKMMFKGLAHGISGRLGKYS